MKKIISFLVIGVISLGLATPAKSQEAIPAEKRNAIAVACDKEIPFFSKTDYKLEDKKYTREELLDEISKASNAFHRFVGCIFDGMVVSLGSLATSNLPETFSAYTPSLPDLRTPAEACKIGPEVDNKLIETSPVALAPVIQSKYGDFMMHLDNIIQKSEYEIKIESIEDTGRSLQIQKEILLAYENELQVAVTSITISLNAIKEMRQAYLLHLELNCWVNHLEGWRSILADIRKVVHLLPEKFSNASTSCPLE